MPAMTLAEKAGVSASYVSKIENDQVTPSLDTLRRIVEALDTSYHRLLMDSDEPGGSEDRVPEAATVVTRGERKRLEVPNRGPVYEILSPDLQGAFEFVWVEQEPGIGGEEFFAHEAGSEAVFVTEGALQVGVGGTTYELQAGDCLTFDATQPHRYVNEGKTRAVWVYVAVPPSL